MFRKTVTKLSYAETLEKQAAIKAAANDLLANRSWRAQAQTIDLRHVLKAIALSSTFTSSVSGAAMKSCYAIAGLIASVFSSSAFGWGHQGHAVIDQAAVAALPADGPQFLRKYETYIADSATLPDSWRQQSIPFSKMDEDPNHGWFMEQFAFLHDVPRSRIAFILDLYKEQQRLTEMNPAQAAKINVYGTGTLAYELMDVYGHLVVGLRAYRSTHAAHKPTDSLEASCAFYVAWLGHYVGDGAQPLHTTIHHDGWVGPDPKGYTTDHRIHARFESDYVKLIKLSERDVQAMISPLGHLHGDVFELTLAYLSESHRDVELVYQLDKQHAFSDPNSREARDLVYRRIAAGSSMLRDLVYRAWLESALPLTSGQPAPQDPANPRYDPATGSAPASLSPAVGG